MATPPTCDFGWQATDFSLPGTDGKTHTLADITGENGTLIMFICNHCPYVVSVLDRIIADAHDIMKLGIGVVAISANDATSHPADSFENMRKIALPFPYLYDESQTTARAYDAACTPDFFGINAKGQLQYRGRLDAASRAKRPADMRRDLYEAMAQIAATGKGPQDQVPSMGCSIKWKSA